MNKTSPSPTNELDGNIMEKHSTYLMISRSKNKILFRNNEQHRTQNLIHDKVFFFSTENIEDLIRKLPIDRIIL